MHFDPRFTRDPWVCPDCVTPEDPIGMRDTQEHIIMACPANADLRVGRDLTEDKDLVEFFQEVISRRQSRM